jgi:hypothetical protein
MPGSACTGQLSDLQGEAIWRPTKPSHIIPVVSQLRALKVFWVQEPDPVTLAELSLAIMHRMRSWSRVRALSSKYDS